MRKFVKYAGLFIIIVVIAVTVYYTHAVLSAGAYTQNVILTDLEKSQCRPFNGKPSKFAILANDLSQRQKRILLKVQDPGFYEHNGMDLSTPGAGLTTLTQAIVKKLYFERFTPGIAKIKQSLIAILVADRLISKNDQMTLFINMMYFGKVAGRPVVGLRQAAAAYYNRSLNELTEDQYISLIAMIVMPGTFHIIDHPDWNRDRVNRIKALIAGEYEPKGLMDQFYGKLPSDVLDAGVPPGSYFGGAKK